MVSNIFKAVFNPINRELSVLYGDCISNYFFSELDEWCIISFNSDSYHLNYLHIHLHYEGSLQLSFYPREENDPSFHEGLGVYFNSNNMNNIPEQIQLVYTDKDFEIIKKSFNCGNEKNIII